MDNKQPESTLILLANAITHGVNVLAKGKNSEDNNQVYQAAVAHGVSGLIASQYPSPSELSTPLATQLHFYYQQYQVIDSFVNQEATKLLLALKEKNIDVVVLKGFSLAQQLYSNSALRPKTDIDILIHPADEELIHTVFLDHGYYNPRGWQPKAISHEVSYKKTLGKNLSVIFDIHLKISNNPLIEDVLNYENLLNRANTTTINGIHLIDTKNAFIHAVLHLLHHRVFGDQIKLIWYYDLYLLLDSFSADEKKQLLKHIEEKSLSQLFIKALQLTQQYFPTPTTVNFIQALQEQSFDEKFNFLLIPKKNIARVWLQLSSDNSISQKLNYLKETLFPPREEVYLKYGKVHVASLPYYYVKRIILGVIKFCRKR